MKINRWKINLEPTPLRDWRIIVLTFFILLAGVFSYYYFVYLQLKQASDPARLAIPEESLEQLKIGELNQAGEWLAAREEQFTTHLQTRPAIADPSL